MCSTPARDRQIFTVAGLPGWSQGVEPAGKSRSLITTSSPGWSRSASAARLQASELHEQIATSAAEQAEHTPRQLLGRVELGIVALAAIHAQLVVAEVLRQRVAHGQRRDALGGGVEVG